MVVKNQIEEEVAAHCSEQASNPGWRVMHGGLAHGAGAAGAQGRARKMRAPQGEARQ
jgi:hypothetical protein